MSMLPDNVKNIKLNKHIICALVAVSGSLAAAYLLYKWKFSKSYGQLDEEIIKELTALELKERGNHRYRSKKFAEAKESYLKAIEKINEEDWSIRSILYSNIAAACDGLNDLEGVFENSTKSISINPHYPKAYIRRALAYQKTNKTREYITDLATSFVLSGCTDANRMQIDESITKLVARQVEEEFKDRELPRISLYSVRRFTSDLFPDDIFCDEDIEHVKLEFISDSQLNFYLEMLNTFRNGEIAQCISQATSILEQCNKADLNALQQRILLLRATCYFSVLNTPLTMEDSNTLLGQPSISLQMKIAAHIRVVSLHLHTMELDSALSDLQELRGLDPNRAHTSYVLGQLYMLLMNFTMAKHCTKRAMNLNPHNLNYQVQMLIIRANEAKTSGQQGTLSDIIDEMRDICKTNSENVEYSVELAQLLHDSHQTDEAEQRMNKALQKADDVYKPYLLTQKALQLASQNRYDEAALLVEESLQLDKCNETAYQMKAVLCYKRERVLDAIDAFKSASKVARGQHALIMALATILSLEIQLTIMNQLSLPLHACSHFTSYLRTFDAI